MTSPAKFLFPRLLLFLLAATPVCRATVAAAQQAASSAVTPADFAGTWHWMFQGKAFATMVIDVNANAVTGSITGVLAALEHGDDHDFDGNQLVRWRSLNAEGRRDNENETECPQKNGAIYCHELSTSTKWSYRRGDCSSA